MLDNHTSVWSSFGINVDKDSLGLPYIYWIPKLHTQKPYNQRFIPGSSRCSTMNLSIFLTKRLSTVKDVLQKYCSTAYSRNGVNRMWILKDSKDLINNLHSSVFNNVHSIRSYEFSTLYICTTIPHKKLKPRLVETILSVFLHKKGSRYKVFVLHPLGNHVVNSNTKYDEEAIIRMLNLIIDNIYLLCLVAQCSNKLLEFQWVLTVLLSLHICSCILMKSNSFRSSCPLISH